jgi:hypothetical protein
MPISAEDSKQALLMLKQTPNIDGQFKMQWSFDDLASMDLLNQEDLAECILCLTLKGNESLVRTLVERRGLVPVNVQTLETLPPTYLLNGKPVVLGVKFLNAIDRHKVDGQLNSLLDMIVEFGIKGLIDHGESYPLLLRNVYSNPIESVFDRSQFEGYLPELSEGVVSHPELAIALRDRSARAAAPEAYQPLLCWASEDMVRQFPENLMPLRVFQEVEGHGTLAQWKAQSGEPGNLDFDCISIGIEATDKNTVFASCLIESMAPEASKKGFSDINGRLLCETTTNFLLQFETSACSEKNIHAATKFVDTYCPVLIMAKKAAAFYQAQGIKVPYQGVPQIFVTDMRSNFDALINLMVAWDETSERVKTLITKDQWAHLAKRSQSSIEPACLHTLWKELGIDNTGLQLALDGEQVVYLAKNDYRFSSDTRVFENESSSNEYSENNGTSNTTSLLIEDNRVPYVPDYFDGRQDANLFVHAIVVFKKILASNLWPTEEGRPKDLKEALLECNGLDLGNYECNRAMLLRAYLTEVGVDECAETVSRPNQWLMLTTVFGADELKPYLGIMPKAAKGRVLENSLGL